MRTITVSVAMLVATSCALIGSATDVQADLQVEANANGLRLQQYSPNGPTVVWLLPAGSASFLGTGCLALELPATSPQAERSRFFALILAAKAMNKTVWLWFGGAEGPCKIFAFSGDDWR